MFYSKRSRRGPEASSFTEPLVVSDRLGILTEIQSNEMFDARALQFYSDVQGNIFNTFVAETLIALLRLAPWAVDGKRLEWSALYDDYLTDEEYPNNLLLYSGTMKENPHGLDRIAKALCSIINWKTWGFPNLATDEVASSDVYDNLQKGTVELMESGTIFPVHTLEPSIHVVLEALRYRLYAETDFIFETEKPLDEDDKEILEKQKERVFAPDAGYVDILTSITKWYHNLDDPLETLGTVMGTLPYLLESLSKQEFVNRLGPHLGLGSSLPDLPRFDIAFGPLAYGSNIILGDFIIKVDESQLAAFAYRLQRNQSIPFNIVHTKFGVEYDIPLRPTDLYALCIDYILSVNTPGSEAIVMSDDTFTNFWGTAWFAHVLPEKEGL